MITIVYELLPVKVCCCESFFVGFLLHNILAGKVTTLVSAGLFSSFLAPVCTIAVHNESCTVYTAARMAYRIQKIDQKGI